MQNSLNLSLLDIFTCSLVQSSLCPISKGVKLGLETRNLQLLAQFFSYIPLPSMAPPASLGAWDTVQLMLLLYVHLSLFAKMSEGKAVHQSFVCYFLPHFFLHSGFYIMFSKSSLRCMTAWKSRQLVVNVIIPHTPLYQPGPVVPHGHTSLIQSHLLDYVFPP